jgi:hypothetical protein
MLMRNSKVLYQPLFPWCTDFAGKHKDGRDRGSGQSANSRRCRLAEERKAMSRREAWPGIHNVGRAWPVEGAIKCHQNQGDLLRPL